MEKPFALVVVFVACLFVLGFFALPMILNVEGLYEEGTSGPQSIIERSELCYDIRTADFRIRDNDDIMSRCETVFDEEDITSVDCINRCGFDIRALYCYIFRYEEIKDTLGDPPDRDTCEDLLLNISKMYMQCDSVVDMGEALATWVYCVRKTEKKDPTFVYVDYYGDWERDTSLNAIPDMDEWYLTWKIADRGWCHNGFDNRDCGKFDPGEEGGEQDYKEDRDCRDICGGKDRINPWRAYIKIQIGETTFEGDEQVPLQEGYYELEMKWHELFGKDDAVGIWFHNPEKE